MFYNVYLVESLFNPWFGPFSQAFLRDAGSDAGTYYGQQDEEILRRLDEDESVALGEGDRVGFGQDESELYRQGCKPRFYRHPIPYDSKWHHRKINVWSTHQIRVHLNVGHMLCSTLVVAPQRGDPWL